MLFGKKKTRQVPGLDTTSTADISFMLLIFFLVTTSLDTDDGLTRYLPPMPQKNEQKQMDVNRNDIMNIRIDDSDLMTCNGDTISSQQLEKKVASFIIERGRKHVISVKADRHTSYEAYFAMQNVIVNAYSDVRDMMARRDYNTPYARCSQQQRDEIAKKCPQRISEAEPTSGEGDNSGDDLADSGKGGKR